MAPTKTKEQTQTTVPPVQPQGKPPAKVEKIGTWESFQIELEKRAEEIGSQLPSTITRDRFKNAAIAAVKANPEILTATPRTLFAAIVKAAQDGLLPDGREGVITVFNTKVSRRGEPDRYEVHAQWNPMFYGIRKRARELDGIIIDAQVVVDGDDFAYELGDSPRIHHIPKAQAEALEPKAGIAAYAIFRHPQLGILHREVMWKPEIFKVMHASRNSAGLMWTTFWTEGWKKTVGRRGAKSVPVSPQLERIITRDDANFAFDNTPTRPLLPMTAPEPPADDEIEDEPDPSPPTKPAAALQKPDQPEGPKNEAGARRETAMDWTDFFNQLDAALGAVDTADLIEEVWDAELDVESTLAHDAGAMEVALKIKTRHLERVSNAQDRRDLEAAGQQGFSFGADDEEDDPPFPGDLP